MKGTVEYFIGMILFAIIALVSITYISATMNTSNARNYHASVINEIEASNFNPEVIESLYEDAREKQYILEPIVVTEIATHKRVAEVILHYNYDIGLLNIDGEMHQIRGFAR